MEHQERLLQILKKSDMLMEVLYNINRLKLDTYYIGAGCLAQTVWNELTERPLDYGITDIDIVYFDSRDLSYEAEDKVIRDVKELFPNISMKFDIKNQARVHMWYKDKFGIDLPPYKTIEQAIDTWPTTATAFGIRKVDEDGWKVYAPFGLFDLFNLIVRPNKKLITEEIYMKKADKWKGKWPELQIMKWD